MREPSGDQASPCTPHSSPVSVVTRPARSTIFTTPRSSKRHGCSAKRDARAVRRHARIAQVAARFVQARARRIFEAIAAVAKVVHDGQRGAVGRPVRLAHLFHDGARRAADGHARERAAVQAMREGRGVGQERQLALARYGQQMRMRDAKRLRRFRVRVDDEQIGRQIAARRCAVDDRLTIGHEARVGDREAIERARLEARNERRARIHEAARPVQPRESANPSATPTAAAAAIATPPRQRDARRGTAARFCRAAPRSSPSAASRGATRRAPRRTTLGCTAPVPSRPSGPSPPSRKTGAGAEVIPLPLETASIANATSSAD